VTLLISPKEIDQTAVKSAVGMRVTTLPAVGFSPGTGSPSCAALRILSRGGKTFLSEPPEAVLAMGGFTGAPPCLRPRAPYPGLSHESNTIPGRANRWLSRIVGQAFVGFPETAARLRNCSVKVTGNTVRPNFQPANVEDCRALLGLDRLAPSSNHRRQPRCKRIERARNCDAAFLAKLAPDLQLFHLTGPNDKGIAEQACAANHIQAVVRPFY